MELRLYRGRDLVAKDVTGWFQFTMNGVIYFKKRRLLEKKGSIGGIGDERRKAEGGNEKKKE